MGSRIVTTSAFLSGMKDGESSNFYRISSDRDALMVDSNNISDRLNCTLMQELGSESIPTAAWWTLEVKAREEVLETYQPVTMSENLDYALPNGPFDQYGKYGRATHLVVMAFSDMERVTELAHRAFALNRQHPQYFPRTEPWDAGHIYRNGEYLLCSSYDEVDGVLIPGEQAVYLWANPVPGNSAISPGEDVVKNPRTTCWQKHSKWPILMTEAFMSNFAKLGSAVFSGDYMLSQHGKDAAGADTVDYRKFDESQIGKPDCAFTPNILLNLLSGMAMFANGNAKFNPDGTVEIKGRFEAENKEKRTRIVLDPVRCGVQLFMIGDSSPVAEFSFSNDGKSVYPVMTMRNGEAQTEITPGSFGMYDSNSTRSSLLIDSTSMVATPPAEMYNMPGVLYCGHFGGDGVTHYEWADGAGKVSCRRTSVGTYIVEHKIDSKEYFVSIIPVSLHTFATLQGKEPYNFSFSIADRNRGLVDLEFDLMIFGKNNWLDKK